MEIPIFSSPQIVLELLEKYRDAFPDGNKTTGSNTGWCTTEIRLRIGISYGSVCFSMNFVPVIAAKLKLKQKII